MIQIIPAILATSEEQFQKDITRINSASSLQEGWVHIDFADGEFVKNKTIGINNVKKFPSNLKKEAHLMVSYPKDWIEELVQAGFERIIFHIESQGNILEVIGQIKGKGLEVGLAINNQTPTEKLKPYMSKIDIVLVMTIVSGFQGQPFIPEMLGKVRTLKSENSQIRVGVDGAIRDTNIKDIADTKADFAVIGSFLKKGSIEENLESLWEILNT